MLSQENAGYPKKIFSFQKLGKLLSGRQKVGGLLVLVLSFRPGIIVLVPRTARETSDFKGKKMCKKCVLETCATP